MMDLDTQVVMLLFSFVFGAFFGLMFDINYNFLYNNKKVLKMIFTLLFVIVNVLLYFIILKKINNGIIHIYSIFCIIIGFFVENFIKKKIVKRRE